MHGERTFTLSHADGTQHQYVCQRHRGSAGLALCQKLSGAAIEPLVAGLGPVLLVLVKSLGIDGLKSLSLEMVLDHPEILDAIHPEKLAVSMREALMSLQPGDAYSILEFTNRDGKPLANNGQATQSFDEAYAGNYLELARALWEVCTHNRFFPGLGTLVDSGRKARRAEHELTESETSSSEAGLH